MRQSETNLGLSHEISEVRTSPYSQLKKKAMGLYFQAQINPAHITLLSLTLSLANLYLLPLWSLLGQNPKSPIRIALQNSPFQLFLLAF